MVKLDVSLLRFMEEEDFRVLTALELTMRNHDIAPVALIERIAQLPHGGCRKRLGNMLKHKLIYHDNTAYDGYAMKYGAYDYLALRTLCKRGTCVGVGHRIGCGKESDIILVQDEAGHDCVLKLQRLGRCSFRSVIRNRDYKGNGRTRHGESWFYLSRLASQKEYTFMKTLYDDGFPVPKPMDQNRHALVMELVPGALLNNIVKLGDAAKVYRRCLDLMIRLACAGLIHGDFNEFNLIITEEQRVVVIDFPQMVSINHPNAAELFERDVNNLALFFKRRFKVDTLWYPTLADDVTRTGDLDKRVFASGAFTAQHEEQLQRLMQSEACSSTHEPGVDDDEEEEEGNTLNAEEKKDAEGVVVAVGKSSHETSAIAPHASVWESSVPQRPSVSDNEDGMLREEQVTLVREQEDVSPRRAAVGTDANEGTSGGTKMKVNQRRATWTRMLRMESRRPALSTTAM